MDKHNWHWAAAGCLMIGMLLSACQSEKPDQKQVEMEQPEKKAVVSVSSLPHAEDDGFPVDLQRVEKVSVLTNDGGQLFLERDPFIRQLKQSLDSLRKSEVSTDRLDYTVVLWAFHNEPTVVQIGGEALKIGDVLYRGKQASQMFTYIEQAVGEQYLARLNMERMMLSARDIGRAHTLNPQQVSAVKRSLQDAEYLNDPPEYTDPLFPNYVIALDIGGKDIVEIDVLSPVLLSVDYGSQALYYRLSEPLDGVLQEAIPLVTYSKNSIKHLYQANRLRVENESDVSAWFSEARFHGIIRSLSAGTPLQQHPNPGERQWMLTFEFEQETVEVPVYRDYFRYHNRTYYEAGVAQEISKKLEIAADTRDHAEKTVKK